MGRSTLQVALITLLPALLVAQQTPQAAPAAPAQATAAAAQPSGPPARVFITDSNSWEVRGSAGGSSRGFAAASAGGARPQTAEVIKTFGQRCPQVVVNNRVDVSDYVVELDHEGGKGLLNHKDKIVVFVQTSGDSIFSKSTLSVGGSVQDACEAITAHWAAHAAELRAALAPAPAPTTPPAVTPAAVATAASLSVSSTPPGADIEIDGAFVGSTPSTLTVTPGTHQVVIKKKGFADWTRKLNVTGGTVNLAAELDVASN
ncbi:MAG: PEGA domain-containing protein [Acidobacteriaceae bacterium]